MSRSTAVISFNCQQWVSHGPLLKVLFLFFNARHPQCEIHCPWVSRDWRWLSHGLCMSLRAHLFKRSPILQGLSTPQKCLWFVRKFLWHSELKELKISDSSQKFVFNFCGRRIDSPCNIQNLWSVSCLISPWVVSFTNFQRWQNAYFDFDLLKPISVQLSADNERHKALF